MGGGLDMNFNNHVFQLEKVHQDFINDPYFTVFTILTPRRDWLCIDVNCGDIENRMKQAIKAEISNLVVTDGDITKGYLNVQEWTEEKITLDNWKTSYKPINEHSFQSSMSLLQTVKKMSNDSKGLKKAYSPLYFVFDSFAHDREPIGIVTYWDLNRAPAYIFSYAIQIYLEHTILLAIRDSHELWEDHSPVIGAMNPKLRDGIKKFMKNGKYNYDALSGWSFPEMLEFYKNDPHIDKEIIGFSNDAINSISISDNYRNRVGHPVRLMVEDDDCFHEDLERLSVIWKMGKETFLKFTNPKVRHSSPSAEERKNIFKGQDKN